MWDCTDRTVLCFLTRYIRWQHPIAGLPALHFTFFSSDPVKKISKATVKNSRHSGKSVTFGTQNESVSSSLTFKGLEIVEIWPCISQMINVDLLIVRCCLCSFEGNLEEL